jgi:hypothetical protein
MLIIKFFSSFGSSEGCIEAYTRVSELFADPAFNKTYRFTTGDDYTHAIILNTAMPPTLNLPKERVIGLAFEPLEFLNLTPAFVEYARKHISTYLIGQNRIGPNRIGPNRIDPKMQLPSPPFIEHFSYMWHLTPLTTLPEKTKRMSLMISNKMLTAGHQYRHTLCKMILNSYLPIDIYGNGCVYYEKFGDMRLKGKFTENEPYEDYMFHIAIENVESPHYFSEKIMNPLLCNTVPIYLGCEHIDDYFPDMVIKLTGEAEADFALLTAICLNKDRYLKPIDVAAVKQMIHFSNVVDFFTP